MKPTYLPKDPNLRTQLITKLQQKLSSLTSNSNPPQSLPTNNQTQNIDNNSPFEFMQNQQSIYIDNGDKRKQIEILKLRIKLIGDCTELSVTRIQHLEEIFKHYCTHIFKIGKHMTFQRLEYEKVHLTLDRLCVFLKDFNLTTAKIDEVEHEIIEKKEIVRNFKRLSSNCRDLNFQEFIACLQKLAILYYDEKQVFQQKTQKFKQKRQARILQYRRKMKQKRKQQQARKKALQANQIQQNHDQNKQQEPQQGKEEVNEQNDDLVENMMKDDKIQHVDDQINKAAKGEEENQFQTQVKGNNSGYGKSNHKNTPKKQLSQQYILTADEKIEYFYQLISVDNIHDFRKKMSELGLPIFKQYAPTGSKPPAHKRSSSEILTLTVQNNQRQDERRLIQLRQKLNMKKQRDKHLYSPMISKDQYEERKKRREQKQQILLKQAGNGKGPSQTEIKQRQKKKLDIMDKQLSLDMINHISFNQVKIKFDPKKYIHGQQSDKIYLNEYGGGQIDQLTTSRKKNKYTSNLQLHDRTTTTLQRKRTSSNIVEDFKKRAYEIEVKQFHKEAQLSKFVNQMKKKQKWRKQII